MCSLGHGDKLLIQKYQFNGFDNKTGDCDYLTKTDKASNY